MATLYQRPGSPYFQASISVGGVRRRISTEETDRRKAQKKADAIEEQLNREVELSTGLRFSDAAARFLKVKPLKDNTHSAYSTCFANIYAILGDFSLPSLEEKDITHYVNEKMKQASKHPTKTGMSGIVKDIAFLSSLLSLARHWEPMLTRNVAKDYDKSGLPKSKERTVWLREDDVQSLIDNCNQPYQMLFIMIAVFTGMRRSEILNLRWDEIDFRHREIVLDNLGEQKTKTGQVRIIPLADALCDTLVDTHAYKVSDYVFYNRKTKKPYTTFKTFWGRVRKDAGLENVRIHDLRHTFASWARQRGMDEITVMNILGHKTRSMLKRYSHSSRESLHDNVKKMAGVTVSVTRPHHSQIAVDGGSTKMQRNQKVNGAAYVTRTRDPIITNDVLYRLS